MPLSPIEQQWMPLFEPFKRLRANWPTRGWTWDARLSCATSSFSAEFESRARACALEAMPAEWTPTNLAKASQPLRELVERSGGLRTGQLLFSTTPILGITAFGLWWPWRTGETISLRVGLLDVGVMEEPYPEFRDLLGVLM